MGHSKDEDFENSREEKEMEMTKEHLESYRKLMQDIRLLREELNEMRSSEAGLGSSVVFDYRKGYPRPQAVDQEGEERANWIDARWCDGMNRDGLPATWTYETEIPCERFDIWEDGEVYCVGLVFSIEDLK